jgi:hypothetical protein
MKITFLRSTESKTRRNRIINKMFGEAEIQDFSALLG